MREARERFTYPFHADAALLASLVLGQVWVTGDNGEVVGKWFPVLVLAMVVDVENGHLDRDSGVPANLMDVRI